MILSGIENATFLLVAQYIDQLRYRMPIDSETIYLSGIPDINKNKLSTVKNITSGNYTLTLWLEHYFHEVFFYGC
jgi:hypothetical protein